MDNKEQSRIIICNEDYLPDGLTFDELIAMIEKNRPIPMTKENLAKIIDPKYLDMTYEELIDYIKTHNN